MIKKIVALTLLASLSLFAQGTLPRSGKMQKLGVDSIFSFASVGAVNIYDTLHVQAYYHGDSTALPALPSMASGNIVIRGMSGIYYQYPNRTANLDSVTLASNLSGSGVAIYKSRSGVTEQFKRLDSLYGISIIDMGDSIGFKIDTSLIATRATAFKWSVAGSATKQDSLRMIPTTDQVNISQSGNTATFSLPQSIASTSSPTFNSLTLSGTVGNSTADINFASSNLILDGLASGAQLQFQGLTSLNGNGLLYEDGTGIVSNVGDVATGQVLTSQGTTTIPAWSASPSLTGLTLSGLTKNSVPFIGTGGTFRENNSNFWWDSTLAILHPNRLTLGSAYGYSTLAIADTGGGSMYGTWRGQRVDIFKGTSGAPVTAVGSVMKINKTQQYTLASVNNNKADADATSAMTVINQSTSGDSASSTGMFIFAQQASNIGSGTDANGLEAKAECIVNGVATGMYAEGLRDSTLATAIGAEIRATDQSSTAASYTTSGAPATTGIWLTANSKNTSSQDIVAAIAIGKLNATKWNRGITLQSTAIDSVGYQDNSAKPHAMLLASGSGDYGFGTLTPDSNFTEIGSARISSNTRIGGNLSVAGTSYAGSGTVGTRNMGVGVGATTIGAINTVENGTERLVLGHAGGTDQFFTGTVDGSAFMRGNSVLLLGVGGGVRPAVWLDASNRVGIRYAPAGGTTAFDVYGAKMQIDTFGLTIKDHNLTTVGQGHPIILQQPAISATKTGNFTVFSYTPASTAARMRVSAVITTTSSTNTGTIGFTLDYKDSQGSTHTGDAVIIYNTTGTAGATVTSAASTEFTSVTKNFTIDNSGTAIALKVVTTGSVSYTVTGTLEILD